MNFIPMETKKGNALAWLALIVGILALILAWSAYNRAGADLEDQAENEIEEVIDVDEFDDEDDVDMVDDETATDTSAEVEVETDAVVE